MSLGFRNFLNDRSVYDNQESYGHDQRNDLRNGERPPYCMNLILVQFTVTATAVFGVYFKLQSFFFMPVFGLNNGITPIIAYNYGARHRKRMLKTVKVSMFIAFCFTFIGFLAFEFIPKTLLGLFSASEDMLTIGIPALRIIGIHYLIA